MAFIIRVSFDLRVSMLLCGMQDQKWRRSSRRDVLRVDAFKRRPGGRAAVCKVKEEVGVIVVGVDDGVVMVVVSGSRFCLVGRGIFVGFGTFFRKRLVNKASRKFATT